MSVAPAPHESLPAAPPPLERARTLPPRCYRDPALYALEEERIFRREWLAVGRADQLPEAGDYFAFDLLGEPLVAVRDEGGRVRVLSRVCRHRYMPVVEGRGNRRSFQCPYHLWSYGLDGRLRGAPEMQGSVAFERASCRLPELRVELWEGWIFASFDAAAAPLAPRLEALRRAVAPYRPAELRTTEPLVFDHDWNWKVMVENFVESYHHMGVHADTLQPLVPAAGTFGEDGDGPCAILHNPTRDGAPLPALFPVTPGLSAAQRADFVVGAVFPFHLFSVQQDSMLWYQLEPESAERFRLRIFPCVPAAALEDKGLAARLPAFRDFVDAIHRQDIAACQGVQRGLRSRLAEPGPLSQLERCVWQLHRYVAERLAGSAQGAGA
jgi:phenylpropionate dioxygenase-like ring-hydroxylating dioxygenase large terminal subunit